MGGGGGSVPRQNEPAGHGFQVFEALEYRKPGAQPQEPSTSWYAGATQKHASRDVAPGAEARWAGHGAHAWSLTSGL